MPVARKDRLHCLPEAVMHATRLPFKYTPAALTDIRATFARFGFRPTTDAERRARQRTVDRNAWAPPGPMEGEADTFRRRYPLD